MQEGTRPGGRVRDASRTDAPDDGSGGGARRRARALALGAALAGVAASGLWLAERVARSEEARAAALADAAHAVRIARLEAGMREAEAARVRAEEAAAAALARLAAAEAEALRGTETARAQALTLAAVRERLAEAQRIRDLALREARVLGAELAAATGTLVRRAGTADDLSETLGTVSLALAETAAAREAAAAEAARLAAELAAVKERARIEAQRTERVLLRVEEAVVFGLAGLDAVIRPTGLRVEDLVAEIRRTHSGEGGPLIEASLGTTLLEDDPASARLTALMTDLEQLQLLRIAARSLPLAMPVKDAVRMTSGFGERRDPRTGRARMHEGLDFAGPKGTPIYATAAGVVTFAGRFSGYGNLVKIRHAFGIETVYAHLSAIRVTVGDRVALGQRVGDMGNTGRSTGTHLHYEVHHNGTPVNPMTYLKAARDVL